MFFSSSVFSLFLTLAASLATICSLHAEEPRARNVIFITTDGFRWQEVFRGADDAMMNKEFGGVPDAAKLTEEFGGDTPEARRERLLPFFWSVIAKQGQIYGNRDAASTSDVTNGHWFSYPGYSEFLTGHPDARIASNRPIPNPNINVLEWLQGRPGFAGRVFACNGWQTLTAILNAPRSHIPMWTPGLKTAPEVLTPKLKELDELASEILSPWGDEHYDALVYHGAVDALETRKPRVMYVNFGETDEWAHARRYDRYLESAHRVDQWARALWEKCQALPEYRDCTTFVLTTDHGRGETPKDWTSHGESVPNSGQMWMAALGPDTPALGERKNCAPVTQAQIAATIARFLGEDYPAAIPEAAPAVAEMFPAHK